MPPKTSNSSLFYVVIQLFSVFLKCYNVRIKEMTVTQNEIKPAWYTKKWAQSLLHAVAWVTLFTLPYLLRPSPDKNHGYKENDPLWHIHFIINCVLLTCWFYLNSNVLIPKLIYKKKWWQYGGILLVMLFVQVLVRWIFVNIFISPEEFDLRPTIFFSFFTLLFILACSTTWRIVKDKVEAEQLASDRENENLKTELSLLRSQVSPHFMFNVLNNMVALARKRSDQLEPSLIKLSSLMRYMLYEADEDKVALDKEVDYLQSYIDLQQQRFGAKVQVNVNLQLPENGYEIEPMLLIPFVENAFKHGTGMIPDARIDIELRAKQGLLQFSVMNKYNEEYEEVKDNSSGIGLTNVKRRLNLLYRDNYQLLINKKEGWFVVSLQLHLH